MEQKKKMTAAVATKAFASLLFVLLGVLCLRAAKDTAYAVVILTGLAFANAVSELGSLGQEMQTFGVQQRFTSVIDDRGRSDLFGNTLEVTKRAVADNIASAAELVMGEADEGVPAAVVRGLGLPISDDIIGIESIDASECLFMGLLTNKRK